MHSRSIGQEPIAVVGMSCRFPGARNIEEYWQLLRDGKDSIREVPADRWSLGRFYSPNQNQPAKVWTRRGGFLDRVDLFDASFFGMSPREAADLDPQQRLLLEVAWEAIEDSGLAVERVAGTNAAVFIGGFTLDYKVLQFSEANRRLIETHTATGSMMTMLANRLSFAFDLRGPSVAVDTACSSSLVAVHLACESLWRDESDLALAGGVNVMLKPEYSIAETKGGFLSPDGCCKTFDARANGYVRGEGAGVVVLKSLSRARRDGDRPYALIRGTAVNQNGRSEGITVPSFDAQVALLRAAYARAQVVPSAVHYVEAHGTGTAVGDPIETRALGTVLGEGRAAGEFCVLGSVKPNIGHLEAAAGVAGLIKAALVLEHGEIPPNIHFETPNPRIAFDSLGLRVPRSVEAWPKNEERRFASVNAFGFGGANAHVVLESADEQPRGALGECKKPRLVPFSARTTEALRAVAATLASTLSGNETTPLSDIAHSASVRRSVHQQRAAVVVSSTEELVEQLEAFARGTPSRVIQQPGTAALGRVAFVYTGMGPQWWRMGRELLGTEPVFADALKRVDLLFEQASGRSLLQELAAEEANSRMGETEVAQPANFALQVACTELWRSWGVEPDEVIGHSAGEVTAAWAAGALDLPEAVRVIYHRSRLQQRMSGRGRLLATALTEQEARSLLAELRSKVEVGAINGKHSTALVGDEAGLDQVAIALRGRGVFAKLIVGNVPYHSAFMDPLEDELRSALSDITPRLATTALFSTAVGGRVNGRELDAAYWWKNVRDPVLFAAAASALIEDGARTFIEIGPHPTLAANLKEMLAERNVEGCVVPSLRRNAPELATMLSALGELHTRGCAIRWDQLGQANGAFVRLGHYPWQRERHWRESIASKRDRLGIEEHPLLGLRLRTSRPAWEVELSLDRLPYLRDHKISGAVLLAGAAFVEMALASARACLAGDEAVLKNVLFHNAVFLEEGREPSLQITLDPRTGAFEVCSARGDDEEQEHWIRHASLTVAESAATAGRRISVLEIRARCPDEIAVESCYRALHDRGYEYGPAFRGIRRVMVGPGEAFAEIELASAVAESSDSHRLHPCMLDACLQLLLVAGSTVGAKDTYVPVSIDELHFHRQPGRVALCHAHVAPFADGRLRGDFELCDADGKVLVSVRGVHARRLDTDSAARSSSAVRHSGLYQLDWLRAADDFSRGALENRSASTRAGSWLVLADRGGVADELTHLRASQGENTIRVVPGDLYEYDVGAGLATLRPDVGADFVRLLSDVSRETPLRAVVDLWSLDFPALAATDESVISQVERVGCGAALFLVRALGELAQAELRVWFVTRGAQAVGVADPPLRPLQAPVWGFGRVLAQEQPMIFGGLLDLEGKSNVEDARALLQHLDWPDLAHDQVAIREANRYVAELVRSSRAREWVQGVCLPRGTYVLTGGLGGLALEVAAWLVSSGASHLLLIGRTPLPPRSAWSSLPPDDPSFARVAAVLALEERGAVVRVACADVSDGQQMAQVLGPLLGPQPSDGWPRIRGVIHSAGVLRDQLISQVDASSLAHVMRPKVLGTLHLHRLLSNEPLEFFVMFSSIASLMGSTGQASYAAANAFMDTLAHARRQQGITGLSVNWGPWQEVGMAARQQLNDRFARHGLHALTSERGIRLLADAIREPFAQVGAFDMDWETWIQRFPAQDVPAVLAQMAAASAKGGEPLPRGDANGVLDAVLLATTEGAQEMVIAEYITAVVAQIFRIAPERVPKDQSLSGLGLDSLMATELKVRFETDLRIPIPIVDLLAGPSITSLSSLFRQRLEPDTEELEALLAEVDRMSLSEVRAMLDPSARAHATELQS